MFFPETRKRVVILGCGFAGLELIKQLKKILKDNVDITVVDKSDFFTYTPGLFDYFAGKLKEKNVILKYDELFKDLDVDFVQGKVLGIKSGMKTVMLEESNLKYDYLVVALGSQVRYNHLPRVENRLFHFDSFDNVNQLDGHLKGLFKSIKKDKLATKQRKLTFVVVGAGLTGVELVTVLRNKVLKLCRKHRVSKKHLDITLVDEDKILPQLEERVGVSVHNYLEKQGIHVIVEQRVTRVDDNRLYIEDGRSFATDTIIWCGGIIPTKAIFRSDLRKRVDGGIIVNDHLQSVSNPSVYALGDNVHFVHEKKKVNKTYLHAVDKARYVAINLVHDITGKGSKFEYKPQEDKFWLRLGSWNGVYSDSNLFFDGFFVGVGKSLKDKYNVYKFKNEFKKIIG